MSKMNRAEQEAMRVLAKEKETGKRQLYTRWGKAIPEVPKCEYPRPQMIRRGMKLEILNGRWQYAFRREAEPVEGVAWDGEILVPFSPETDLSGVNRTLKPEEYLHYRRTFEVEAQDPAVIGKQGVLLHFGAVDQECRLYVNGQYVGEHLGGYLSFSFDITPCLRAGENELVLVVRDQSEKAPYPRGKQRYINQGPLSSIFYPGQSGIWKTVWLEWVPNVYITNLKVVPDYDGKKVDLSIEVGCISSHADPSGQMPWLYSAALYDAMRYDIMLLNLMESEELQPDTCNMDRINTSPDFLLVECGGNTDAVLQLPVKNPLPWTPDQPLLYGLKVKLGEDVVESYVGMRCFTVEKDDKGIARICLNHRPIFLNGVLDQGYWPESLMTAPCDDALIHDIKAIKRLGYNTLRKHVKVEEDRFYYHCDRLGVIVIQDMPNGGGDYNMYFQAHLPNIGGNLVRSISDKNRRLFRREDEEGCAEFLVELEGMIRELGNHPCVAAWVPFNEGWGQFDAAKISKQVKAWDPTRLVNEACGWYDQGGGDMFSIHNYYRKLKVKPQGDRVVALTEYGGFTYPVPGHMADENNFGYRHYNNAVEVTANYEKLWREQIFPNIPRGLCCAIYTQLSDICEEQNGLMTWDREVDKVLESRFWDIHQGLLDLEV